MLDWFVAKDWWWRLPYWVRRLYRWWIGMDDMGYCPECNDYTVGFSGYCRRWKHTRQGGQ